ncbi:MAG: C-GCAxxG-C-C family protein [Anaerolineales bacterium]|nr:C-GCAxxG-C-C family protein [Anaerolineales bacterium]
MTKQYLKTLKELETLNENLINQIQRGSYSHGSDHDLLMTQILDARYSLDRVYSKLMFETKLNQLTEEKIREMSTQAEKLMEGGSSRERFHCSEAFVKTVGIYLFGEVGDLAQRMTTGLAGGVGGSHNEMCGGLVGGLLCIGGMFGRAQNTEDDEVVYCLSVDYRQRFIEVLGGAKCFELRKLGYGSSGHTPCGVLVGRSIPVFFEAVLNRKDLFKA